MSQFHLKQMRHFLLATLLLLGVLSCRVASISHTDKDHSHAQVSADSVPSAEKLSDSIFVRVLDLQADSSIVRKVKEFRGMLTSKFKKSGNVAIAETDIEGLSRSDFYAHSSIDTLNQSLAERVPFISLKPNPEIYPWSSQPNKQGIPIPRNGDTEYKIVSEITTLLASKSQVHGRMKLFTELPPCGSCSKAIALFSQRFPHIELIVIYNPEGRLLP